MQGSIMFLTNPENELAKMELSLRSMMVDSKGIARSVGKPLLNEIGICSVMSQVQSIVNQNQIMSNYEEKHVLVIVGFLADTLCLDLMMNTVNYDIQNISARDKIFFLALSTAFSTMMRSKDEGEKRFWKGSTQEITTRVEGMPSGKKKGGVLGFISNAWK